MNDNAKKLVAALRSGEYKQTDARLRKTVDGESRYCCLGVACDLYAKEHPEAKWDDVPGDDYFMADVNAISAFGVVPAENVGLPEAVKEWLGFSETMGELEDNYDEEVDGYSLAGLNDSGEYPFEKIADVIEAKPIGLFS